MKAIGPLKIMNVLLCDDARREALTNKHILIGTYSGNIRLGAPPPVQVEFAFYAEFLAPEGEHTLYLRLSGPGKGSAVLRAAITQREFGPTTLATSRMGILLEREGIFRIDGRVGDEGRWVNLLKKRVYYDPSISPQPLSEQSPPDAPES